MGRPQAHDPSGRTLGHGPMAYYAVLADRGFFPEEWLADRATYDSPLGHHPDRNLVPGVEISSGSLGHGLPLAVGTALGLRAQGIGCRVVVLVGDAELDEGSNHVAAHGLDALGIRASLDGFLNPSGRVPEHEPWSGLRHTTRTV